MHSFLPIGEDQAFEMNIGAAVDQKRVLVWIATINDASARVGAANDFDWIARKAVMVVGDDNGANEGIEAGIDFNGVAAAKRVGVEDGLDSGFGCSQAETIVCVVAGCGAINIPIGIAIVDIKGAIAGGIDLDR